MKPLFNKFLDKGYEWILSLISTTDYSITKVSLFLQEKKKLLEEYMVDRENILAATKNAQLEIEYLQNRITQTNSEFNERLLQLYDKLETRTQDLMDSHQQINNLHSSIEKSKDTISDLVSEKEQAINERNYFRSEYDHLQTIIKENQAQQEELRKNIENLRDNNINGLENAIEQQIREHEETIEKLQIDRDNYEQQAKHFQIKFKEKMLLVAKLSGQLHQVETELNKKQELISVLEQKTNDYKVEIRNYKQEKKRLKSLIIENRRQSVVDKQRILELERVKSELDKKLDGANQIYTTDLIRAEEEIEALKDELIVEQNNLAMEKERNGAPNQITVEALRILEQEYKPRFMTLYKECIIQEEFYIDFFSLIPFDRLKVEACIVSLNFNYDQYISKVRPNTVKTKRGTTIVEYPFCKEGRIYFKKDKGKINLYRISRTKNGKGKLDQDRIITWLQRNK